MAGPESATAAALTEALAERYSNRGRWDEEEPPCALSLVTRSRLLDACALPRRGELVACGLARGEAPDPVRTRILTPRAAPAGVAGRGVLLDLPRAERRPRLEPGEAITPDRLDACAESLGVTVEAGDLLLVRTGALCAARSSGDWEPYRHGPTPGLALACAGWLYRRELGLVASDTRAVEVVDEAGEGDGPLPLRTVSLGDTGVLFGLDFDLGPLARACADDGNYAFLWVAPPLPLAGANPAQPVAVK